MRKATATYVAPFGDNKVVEMGGVTFFDGKSVDLNSTDHLDLIRNLKNNRHFDIVVSEDDNKQEPAKAKRGRPSNALVAEMKAKADAADKAAKDAAEAAKVAKADSDEAVKAAKGSDDKPGIVGGPRPGQQPNPQPGPQPGQYPGQHSGPGPQPQPAPIIPHPVNPV
jgi:hypothetical protein